MPSATANTAKYTGKFTNNMTTRTCWTFKPKDVPRSIQSKFWSSVPVPVPVPVGLKLSLHMTKIWLPDTPDSRLVRFRPVSLASNAAHVHLFTKSKVFGSVSDPTYTICVHTRNWMIHLWICRRPEKLQRFFKFVVTNNINHTLW